MLFLKKIEAFGFKSFAEPTILNFDYEMTGVVGPNGSGKSNINDAIRWALGEQSSKSLRGDNMEDIVFSGSANHAPLNMAEVTLVFNNSQKKFASLEYDEVEITRRYFRLTKESEFYINKNRVRLKDIQDIALETGLTKSSLAIISQGTVSQFVESKPDERRELFDEAAGIAKYKKRKIESIRKLARTQENLDRLNDIINEIERKLPNLKNQAEKAKVYSEKFEQLKNIEIAILIKDIQIYEKKLAELNQEKLVLRNEISDLARITAAEESEFNEISRHNFKSEKEIIKLNDEFTSVIEKIGNLKVKKIAFENQQKNTSTGNEEFKASQLISETKKLNLNLTSEKEKLKNLNNSNLELQDSLKKTSTSLDELNESLGKLGRSIAKVESTLDDLKQKQASNDDLFDGVKNVLNNKHILPGVIGTIQDLISVEKEHEQAIGALILAALQNIVIDSGESAKEIIRFLKLNKAGYATFIPLSSIRPNFISDEQKFVIKKAKGFVGFGNDLVKIDAKYQKAIDYILGTTIVVNNFDEAREIAKLINYKHNIATLDGERILPNGAIVGGSRKLKISSLNNASRIQELEQELATLSENQSTVNQNIKELKKTSEQIREEISQKQSFIGAARKNIEIINIDIIEAREEYRIITGKDIDSQENISSSIEEEILELTKEIIASDNLKEELQQQLNVARSLKDKSLERQNLLNDSTNEKRKLLSALKDKDYELKRDAVLISEKLNTSSTRLVQNYGLTVEAASENNEIEITNEEITRRQIIDLSNEIKNLGNVNLDSIEAFQEENDRYQFYVSETNEVQMSIKNLEIAILNMDNQMVTQFKKVISEVNQTLPETFTALFGGGSAKLIYTDPEDLLNSGIDIQINPPGKKINNINLLSGGEKSMVALSVLFSILKVRPIPMVILDEVEAPLDQANVERFAKYLKVFTKNTQFIVVTHRTGTMENCQVLFGATMQSKGITKIVQIKLVDAKNLVEATG
ncbi:chromosome condensation and segregation SMC ATPase [Spiroplasma sabaudiense Ar-1343]|uniref:Chromosome partition protein Smc n=1 Tax=Spiroplasma sabaudiense Ar-1343 TaxID=1276257 RepID=W6AA39_9MOLU|nr:AAA family ATPase [Spiroplasma sabaudiense]AHI54053.1 chromosome condensation and segregation SMC ATPase [Spiroplasma sabaudiense Ar-1343]